MAGIRKRARGDRRRPARRLPLVAALFAALLLTAPPSASALDRTVSVSVTITREVPNDTAEIGLFVSKDRRDRSAALRVVAVRLSAVIAAVRAFPGVGPGDVSTGNISVRRIERGEHPRYRASEGVTVILHRPDLAGELVSAGVAAGATGTRGPRFFVGDREAAYEAALVQATERARAKAAKLAVAAGATLGPVVSIAESGGVELREQRSAAPKAACPRGPRDRSCDEPAPPVEPGESTVTATVNAVFSLQ